MVELRHSSSLGSRASNSPMKCDTGDSSPLIPDNHLADDDEHDQHSSKDRDRHMCSFFTDNFRVSPHNSRIFLVFTFLLLLVGLVSIFTIFNNLVSPHLSGCIFRFTTKSLGSDMHFRFGGEERGATSVVERWGRKPRLKMK
ncbi:hypothetical protein GYH30_033619 [Glycine max]|nr:hypothetical protein GYH30_033619 [Glycine max]